MPKKPSKKANKEVVQVLGKRISKKRNVSKSLVQSQDQLHSQDSDSEYGSFASSSTPISQVKPENYAIKSMKFRQRRGTKMNYLMNCKKDEQDGDLFWKQQGQHYFGNVDDNEEDSSDYVQSSLGRDQFDSDFALTQSEQDIYEAEKEEELPDEDKNRNKKKNMQFMRRINAAANEQSPKNVAKTAVPSTNKRAEVSKQCSDNKKQQSNHKDKQQNSSKKQKKAAVPICNQYIHQACNQQQLLGQAASTEYFNWISLQKLISLQVQKKDFRTKSHHIEGPKVIIHDRITADNKRELCYELDKVEVRQVADLSKYCMIP